MEHKPASFARRGFLAISAFGIAAPALLSRAGAVLAQDKGKGAAPHLDEKDAAAQQLGYRQDASKVDKKKYAQYKPGEACGNCLQFQGRAGAAWGPCTIFPGKEVNAKGWCSAYAKKG